MNLYTIPFMFHRKTLPYLLLSEWKKGCKKKSKTVHLHQFCHFSLSNFKNSLYLGLIFLLVCLYRCEKGVFVKCKPGVYFVGTQAQNFLAFGMMMIESRVMIKKKLVNHVLKSVMIVNHNRVNTYLSSVQKKTELRKFDVFL